MPINIIRTRLGKRDEIVAEVAVPSRRNSRKVVIFCGGMPGMPSKRTVLENFAKKGYWAILPRYRGTWESDGEFLHHSPADDIIEVINTLEQRGVVVDFWSGEEFSIEPRTIHVLGVSFGGAAALLAARDERVGKVVAISPVVDWRAPSKEEPLDWLYGFMKNAFGQGYRTSKKNWNKLARGTFFNPAAHADEIPGEKVWIIHARDDGSVVYKPVEKFAKKIGAKLTGYKRGGHLSSSILFKRPALERKLWQFFRDSR